MKSEDLMKMLVQWGPILLILAVVYFIWNSLSSVFNGGGTGSGASTPDHAAQAEPPVTITAPPVVPKGQVATKSAQEWASIADIIFSDLRYDASWDNNTDDAAYQICRCKNDADWALLYQKFGTRTPGSFQWFTNSMDLNGFVAAKLTPSQINTINSNFTTKKMSKRF